MHILHNTAALSHIRRFGVSQLYYGNPPTFRKLLTIPEASLQISTIIRKFKANYKFVIQLPAVGYEDLLWFLANRYIISVSGIRLYIMQELRLSNPFINAPSEADIIVTTVDDVKYS